MADFIKLNGYIVKDVEAGKGLSLDGLDLTLEKADGSAIDTVTLPIPNIQSNCFNLYGRMIKDQGALDTATVLESDFRNNSYSLADGSTVQVIFTDLATDSAKSIGHRLIDIGGIKSLAYSGAVDGIKYELLANRNFTALNTSGGMLRATGKIPAIDGISGVTYNCTIGYDHAAASDAPIEDWKCWAFASITNNSGSAITLPKGLAILVTAPNGDNSIAVGGVTISSINLSYKLEDVL